MVVGVPAVESCEVATEKVLAVCAPVVAVLVMPLNVNVPAVELASAHVPPSVITTVFDPELGLVPKAVEPVHEPVKPLANVTVEVAGTVIPVGNETVIIDPALSAPLDEGVNPTVHVVTADAVVLAGAKVTPVTAVAAVMVTAALGLAAVVSEDVTTLKPAAASDCAVGLTIPVNEIVPAADPASAQVPFKVTVTV
jgi:hypothetical protein